MLLNHWALMPSALTQGRGVGVQCGVGVGMWLNVCALMPPAVSLSRQEFGETVPNDHESPAMT